MGSSLAETASREPATTEALEGFAVHALGYYPWNEPQAVLAASRNNGVFPQQGCTRLTDGMTVSTSLQLIGFNI
jgi:hypothetical protein